jgi:hypothetical protein
VVSHAFELYAPLLDLKNRGANVLVAYFASLLDPRWRRVGLFDDAGPFKFLNLDDFGDRVVGVDLAGRSRVASSRQASLISQF